MNLVTHDQSVPEIRTLDTDTVSQSQSSQSLEGSLGLATFLGETTIFPLKRFVGLAAEVDI